LVDQNNNNVDAVDCLEGWSYGSNETKKTMERSLDLKNWQTSLNPGGTPKQKNSFIENQSGQQFWETNRLAKRIVLLPGLLFFFHFFLAELLFLLKNCLNLSCKFSFFKV